MEGTDIEKFRRVGDAFIPDLFARLLYVFIKLLFRLCDGFRGLSKFLFVWRTPTSQNAPSHVALAGDIRGHENHIARLALTAERAGASRFSVCTHDAAEVEKACAQAGVRIPVRVRAPAPRSRIVSAARTLARIPPSQRGCDVRDVNSVVRAIDDWHCVHELETEPDVLVIVPYGLEARCFASFSVWQLRLTQFRFSDSPISQLSDQRFLGLICSASKVAKRFGR